MRQLFNKTISVPVVIGTTAVVSGVQEKERVLGMGNLLFHGVRSRSRKAALDLGGPPVHENDGTHTDRVPLLGNA